MLTVKEVAELADNFITWLIHSGPFEVESGHYNAFDSKSV